MPRKELGPLVPGEYVWLRVVRYNQGVVSYATQKIYAGATIIASVKATRTHPVLAKEATMHFQAVTEDAFPDWAWVGVFTEEPDDYSEDDPGEYVGPNYIDWKALERLKHENDFRH